MAVGNVKLMHECFPKTHAHRNSKREIRQRNRKRMQAEKSEYMKNKSGHERKNYLVITWAYEFRN